MDRRNSFFFIGAVGFAALWGALMFGAGFIAGSRSGGVRSSETPVAAPSAAAPAVDKVAPAAKAAAASPADSVPAKDLPDAGELRRLARKALRDATGRPMHPGPVEVGERLADESYMVVLTLEDGRRVSGRLYRDRLRFRIAVDRRELFSPETTVRIKTQQ